MPRKKKAWSFTAGERGARVTVFERGGALWARVWNPTRKSYVRRSLKHNDKDRAKRYALDEAKRLQEGRAELTTDRISFARLCALYEQHHTPDKSETEQREDARRSEMWCRWLGGKSDPHDISLGQWEGFRRARLSGAIDGRGRPVAKKRRAVRERTVQADMLWLKWLLNWGVNWRENGAYLLKENVVRGYKLPKDNNPRRPIASANRYEKIREHTDDVTMATYVAGKRKHVRSYLSEILDIAYETGRRVNAILNLTYADLDAEVKDETGNTLPFGALRWRGKFDKQGKEWVTPIGPTTRAAIDRVMRERPGIGDAPLFPSRDDRTKPITRHVADAWLRKAEKLAKLETQEGSLWHAYRRGWATARKHLSPIDAAHVGGWSTPATMQRVYQQATMSDMLEVVTSPVQVREKNA